MRSKTHNQHLKDLVALSAFDIHPQQQQERLGDLTRLAAVIAGSSYATINILDADMQWTIAGENIQPGQISRHETVCQYAIDRKAPLEIRNLATHPEYQHLAFVHQHPHLQYYLGIPILTELGNTIGVLCILHNQNLDVSAQTVSTLQMIAGQVVSRLRLYAQLGHAHLELNKKELHMLKLAHDIRNPLNGMIGLGKQLEADATNGEYSNAPQTLRMLNQGLASLLSLADNVLSEEVTALHHLNGVTITLDALAKQVEQLHLPQALTKHIDLFVEVSKSNKSERVRNDKLIQIASNLISNAIKFTPVGGHVRVDLQMTSHASKRMLEIVVADSGIGLRNQTNNIDDTTTEPITTPGTAQEKGFGYGLAIVQMLVEDLNGTIEVNGTNGTGTTFRVLIPQVSLEV
jgi:signal transduction histidine kinase